jgi:hypothetical protein
VRIIYPHCYLLWLVVLGYVLVSLAEHKSSRVMQWYIDVNDDMKSSAVEFI